MRDLICDYCGHKQKNAGLKEYDKPPTEILSGVVTKADPEEKLSFDNIDIPKINRLLEIENRFNWNSKQKESQTTLTDFV